MKMMRRRAMFAAEMAPALTGVAGRGFAQACDYYKDKVINAGGGPAGD